MNRNVSGLANLLLMALMLVGVWLANSSDTDLLVGLLLALGAAAGLIFLARRENALPLGRGEREAWEIIRAKGKRPYILRSVMYGLSVGLIFILYQLIRSRWTGEPFTTSSGFGLMALFIILYIGGSYYAAIRKWALYEERYKESLPQTAQHNKSFEMTPR
ncbi:MAG: hypothetical protein ACJ74W_23270 [Pyrinomonadaceae bacterium]